MSQVKFENRQGKGGESGRFIIRCGECHRVYTMLEIPQNRGVSWTADLSTPIVPCHAGGLEVVGEEAPFERVVRLLEGGEAKEGEFSYTIQMMDGMITGFNVTRG